MNPDYKLALNKSEHKCPKCTELNLYPLQDHAGYWCKTCNEAFSYGYVAKHSPR